MHANGDSKYIVSRVAKKKHYSITAVLYFYKTTIGKGFPVKLSILTLLFYI